MLNKTLLLIYCMSINIVVQAAPVAEIDEVLPGAPITYRPGQWDLSIRRVDAGAAEGMAVVSSRGLSRGWSRGLNRGLTRGLKGGLEGGLSETGAEHDDVQVLLPDRMVALAPQHTGMTINSQPTLYWYVSAASTYAIQFNVNQEGVLEPLVQATLPPPRAEGIYAIRLADYGVHLQADVEYEWFLTMILDEEERSSDFTAGATLRYREPSAEETAWQTSLDKTQLPQHYARSGFWYDAFDSLSQLIERNPQQVILKKWRVALLQQVQLPRAAGFDFY